MSDTAADININNISKHYRDTVAVDNISFDVKQGEFLTLLGPSGCGKTTTLNMIAGFVSPTSGSISIKGQPVTDLPAYERNTGMVFQSYALFPHMTVFDNVAFGLRMRKTEGKNVRQQVLGMLENVQLAGLEDRYPRQLSGGQQQRVALARALVVRPAVLLLDEPLSNLDLKLREAMRFELKSLQRDLGITSVYVTHDQDEALAMSDRIAVMVGGKIEQLDTPDTIYESPSSLFVATFIGATNLVHGTVLAKHERSAEVELSSGEQTLRIRTNDELSVGDAVTVSIRPEKCELTKNRPETPHNHLAAHVVDVLVLGADLQYKLKLVSGAPFTVKALNTDSSIRPNPGEPVYISVPNHNCLGFSAPPKATTSAQANRQEVA